MANDITIVREYLAPDAPNQTTQHSGSDGLVLGRWNGGPDGLEQPCEVILEDPGISRIHAGINQIDDQFYIINLSVGNVFRLNGRWIKAEESGTLADGDVVQIGPFYITVTRKGKELFLRVSARPQATRADAMASSTGGQMNEIVRQAAATPEVSNQAMQGVINVFWERRKKREKAARPSPLHPRTQARPGKVRWNWQPTRDLARPWPFSIFIWATALVAVFAGITALAFANVFSPAPLSNPHQHSDFKLTANGKIANKTNGNSCLTCHSVLGRESVDDKCSQCHQAEGFHSSNTKKHTEAGITCTTCHEEHKGADYKPKQDAFDSCSRCHNDANQKLYGPNRIGVETAHKGTYGYPVKFGKWTWMGLEKEVLDQKPDVVEILKRYRQTHPKEAGVTAEEERQQELNWQFHTIHLYRVKAAPGVVGVQDGVLSCSSCHKTTYPVLDRNYPIEVCAKCHNGYFDELGKKAFVDEGKPNCTSCHVQHYYDKYRWSDLLIDKSRGQRLQAMDDKTVESIIKPAK